MINLNKEVLVNNSSKATERQLKNRSNEGKFLFTDFPHEIICAIFDHLSNQDLLSLGRRTCKTMQFNLMSYLDAFKASMEKQYPGKFPQGINSTFFLRIRELSTYLNNCSFKKLIPITMMTSMSHLRRMHEGKLYAIPEIRRDNEFSHLVVYDLLTQSPELPLPVTDEEGLPILWKDMQLGDFQNTNTGHPDRSLARCLLELKGSILIFSWAHGMQQNEISNCQWNLNSRTQLEYKSPLNIRDTKGGPEAKLKKTLDDYLQLDSTFQTIGPIIYEECECIRSPIPRNRWPIVKSSTDNKYGIYLVTSKDPTSPEVEAVILDKNKTVVLRSKLQEKLPFFTEADCNRFFCVYTDEIFVINGVSKEIQRFKLNFEGVSIIHPHAVVTMGSCLFFACSVITKENLIKELVFTLDLVKGEWLPNPLQLTASVYSMSILKGHLYIAGNNYFKAYNLFPEQDFIDLSNMKAGFEELTQLEYKLYEVKGNKKKGEGKSLTKERKNRLKSLQNLKDNLTTITRTKLGEYLRPTPLDDFFSLKPKKVFHYKRSEKLQNFINKIFSGTPAPFPVIDKPSPQLNLINETVLQAVLWNLDRVEEATMRYQKLDGSSKKTISNYCYDLYKVKYDEDSSLNLTKDQCADAFFSKTSLQGVFITNQELGDMLLNIVRHTRSIPKPILLKSFVESKFVGRKPLDYFLALGWPKERLKSTNVSEVNMSRCGIHSIDDLQKLTVRPMDVFNLISYLNSGLKISPQLIEQLKEGSTKNEALKEIKTSISKDIDSLRDVIKFAEERCQSLNILVNECGMDKFLNSVYISPLEEKIRDYIFKLQQLVKALEDASSAPQKLENFASHPEGLSQISTEIKKIFEGLRNLEIDCQVGIVDLYLGQVGSSGWDKLRKRSFNSLSDLHNQTNLDLQKLMHIGELSEKIDDVLRNPKKPKY